MTDIKTPELFDENGKFKAEVQEKILKLAEASRMSIDEVSNALKNISATGGSVKSVNRLELLIAEIIKPIPQFYIPKAPITNHYKRKHNNKKFR